MTTPIDESGAYAALDPFFRIIEGHFVSVITIKDRKVTHWRDYLDSVAVFNAIGWPAR